MKNNKVLLSFDMNGNFLSIQEDSNKIYAGSVASVEYYVDFTGNLSANDLVYISFTRPDNQKLAPLICERILDNRFKLLSTGEELDYNLTTTEEMTINVIIKTRDIITNVSAIKSQASVVVNVYPGSQFVPGIVDDSVVTNLEEHLNDIEKYTIKKYNVKDIQNGLVLIPYAENGIKEAPAIYMGYSHLVKFYNWEYEEYRSTNVQGNLFVFAENVDSNTIKQYEYLFTDNKIYARTVLQETVTNVTTTITTIDAGDFYDISLVNDTFLDYTDGKITEHNTSGTAHYDIRSLISQLTSQVTENTSDIASNSNRIDANATNISNLTIQVNSNSSLIQDTRNNLASNYYTKQQTYTKDEVKSLLGTAAGFQFVIVEELPLQGDPTKIYLVPVSKLTQLTENDPQAEVDDYYDEYIWLASENRYECIGSTRINIDDYVTNEDFETALNTKSDTTYVDEQLDLKADATEVDDVKNNVSGLETSISSLQTQINNNIANITDLESNKLDKNQGVANAGKVMLIGEDGNLIPQSLADGGTTVIVNGEAQTTWDADTKANVSSLSAVATSGSYSDLTDKPTIPTDNAELTNGANYATVSQIPTNNNQLTNGANYATKSEVSSTYATKSEVSSTYATKTELTTEISNRTTADSNLQGQINEKANNTNPQFYNTANFNPTTGNRERGVIISPGAYTQPRITFVGNLGAQLYITMGESDYDGNYISCSSEFRSSSIYTNSLSVNGREPRLIFDQGTTSNGYWIKYTDSTMEQHFTVTGSRGDVTPHNFLQDFRGIPIVHRTIDIDGSGNASQLRGWNISNLTNTGFNIYTTDISGAETSMISAYGYWK